MTKLWHKVAYVAAASGLAVGLLHVAIVWNATFPE